MPSNSNCALCNRGPARANLVSHSKRRTPRRQRVNIQMRTLKTNGMVRAAVCTRCVRTLSKV